MMNHLFRGTAIPNDRGQEDEAQAKKPAPLPPADDTARAVVAAPTKKKEPSPAVDRSPTDTTTGIGKRKRKPKRLAKDEEDPTEEKPSESTKKKKAKKEDDPEQEFETVWICSECKEAECLMNNNPTATATTSTATNISSDTTNTKNQQQKQKEKEDANTNDDDSINCLLICDGPCRRLFHYPCAGLSALPRSDEPYNCPDCTSQRHRCALCQDYGTDNVDVWLCSRKSCGLFFHEACLAMQDVDVTIVTTEGGENSNNNGDTGTNKKNTRRFVCPTHDCWTCTQTDLREQEKKNQSKKAAEAAAAAIGSKKKGGRKFRSRKNGSNSSFECKSERFLIRCIECPRSYHVSCIPPMARFHELALLCHEHAERCKLPDLDTETSIQSRIETKVEEKFAAELQKRTIRASVNKKKGQNLFFPGMAGYRLTKREEMFNEALGKQGNGTTDDSWFCLPCDIKDEVHSKPPSYRHIHSNRYEASHKPAKIPANKGETCQCVGVCGDDCLNRMLYTECIGVYNNASSSSSASASSNCKVGTNCTNRLLGQRKFKKCRPVREQGKGWGLVVNEQVYKGELVQEYIGEIVDKDEKEKRLKQWTAEHPNDPNFYMMELLPGWFIDARHEANLSRFINHSCDPNCDLTRINVGGLMRNGIFARRDISAGEHLSYDYRFDTGQGDRFVCRCGSKNCRGTMKEVGTGTSPDKKSSKAIWEEAKARYERDKKFVAEHYECEQNRSQVAAAVPCAENLVDESVANGPQARYRDEARRGRLFLWRNAVKGSDFGNRLATLEQQRKMVQ